MGALEQWPPNPCPARFFEVKPGHLPSQLPSDARFCPFFALSHCTECCLQRPGFPAVIEGAPIFGVRQQLTG